MVRGIDVDRTTIPQLQRRMNHHRLSSVQLTRFYLARIQRLNPRMHAVITTSRTAVADAAAALGWSHDACVSAAYGLNLEGLVHLTNGGADRITLSRDGQEYLAAEKRAAEMVWACQYCGHAEKTKQALRAHSAACPNRPKGKGNMGF